MLKKILCVLLVVSALFVNNAPSALAYDLENVETYLSDLCTYYLESKISKVEYPDRTLTTCTSPWEIYEYFTDSRDESRNYLLSEWNIICSYEGHGVGFGPIGFDYVNDEHPEEVNLLCMTK